MSGENHIPKDALLGAAIGAAVGYFENMHDGALVHHGLPVQRPHHGTPVKGRT